MEWIALFLVVCVVVGMIQALFMKMSGQTPDLAIKDVVSKPPGKQDRLTDNQIVCLTCASTSKPIYAENPSHMHSQMPGGAQCFNLRTVQSLVKRGFLVDDQRGGYLLTQEGMIGLKRGMGFGD